MLTWLGIGAQRSGTTWFTDLMLQHPEVRLGRSGEKELHILDRAIEHGGTERVRAAYHAEFDGVPGLVGEWTPSYLRALWAPELAAALVEPEVVLVLLRDPIERFHSALRLNREIAAKRRPKRAPGFLSVRAIEAQWASTYLPQLEAWAAAIGRERMLVLQYEAVVEDPQAAADVVWSRLGVGSVPLTTEVLRSPEFGTDEVVEVDRALANSIRPHLGGLEGWGVDLERWKRLRGSL